jgi:ribonuclease Y
MGDGRIHPARIEEVVDKAKSTLMKSIKEDGDKAMFDLGIHGVNAEIVKLIGSLKYRTSYTQNNYSHSIEVGFLCGMMAAELGLNTKVARRAGALHDIGKALDHSIEGGHAVIGADFAKKYGEPADVVHAIKAHHDDEKPNSVLAELVKAADALSGARPGARREMMETYVSRLEELETIGNSFDGVIRTFAIQAGREIRVLVESEKVTDEQSIMLSRDIARKIEKELTYPGQIKVTVIRETRAVELAR